eukprot:2877224-Lingulodinium_polyedra.AAC.1
MASKHRGYGRKSLQESQLVHTYWPQSHGYDFRVWQAVHEERAFQVATLYIAGFRDIVIDNSYTGHRVHLRVGCLPGKK